ncbi:hypothetical protein IE077_002654 [Cardiosporidium cionae]|uniref:Uncharacterized protein n=1 Tax=Cardiosporidium cionae TaxID=476202 RepID=A0ABQ7JFQ5_9APIC|nr:hypothetical protein IE077_002654 [Cardiosporidium cionae]|eukprot:KAF8822784.1 hypothetical protein IE077_002654 [Cardiosporidium cionae]
MRRFWIFRVLEKIFRHVVTYLPFWGVYIVLLAVAIALCTEGGWKSFSLYDFLWPHRRSISTRPPLTSPATCFFNAFNEMKKAATYSVVGYAQQQDKMGPYGEVYLEMNPLFDLVETDLGIAMEATEYIRNESMVLSFSEKDWTISVSQTHELGILLKQKLDEGLISPIVALIGNLLYEYYKGNTSFVYLFILCLPSVDWYQENGIFSISEEIYNKTSKGTTIEYEQQHALKITNSAFEFLRSLPLLMDIHPSMTLEEIQWAYCILYAFGIFLHPYDVSSLILIFPLQFMRRTLSTRITTRIFITRRSNNSIDVYTQAPLIPGSVPVVYDPFLSTTSIFLYRGLWLYEMARIRFTFHLDFFLQLNEIEKEFLKIHQCYGDPLQFWLTRGPSLNYSILSCLRLHFYLRNIGNLTTLHQRQWFQSWPFTESLDRKCDRRIAQFLVLSFHTRLDSLLANSREIKAEFGKDPLGYYPLLAIRQMEINILSENLKAFQEFSLFAADAELYTLFCYAEKDKIHNYGAQASM